MKKTLFILGMLLSFAFLYAQNGVNLISPAKQSLELRQADLDNNSKPIQYEPSASKDVIYSEGFEETTGSPGNLPPGWTTSAGGVWFSTAGADIAQVSGNVPPHSGTRFLVRSWYHTGGQTWAFSAGFNLTGGTDYAIKFWFMAPGYPGYGEYDDFEVRIGQTATATAMSSATLILENITNRVNSWTLVEVSFIPETTGTYYLGFHDLTPTQEGLYIGIDDIEVSEALCSSVKNLAVTYTEGCEAQITWTAPGEGDFTYLILRDGEEIATVTTESYTDTDFEPTLEHTWSVKVVCDDIYSVVKNVYKDACLETSCIRAKYLSVTYNEDCNEALLKWNAPTEILWDNTAGPTMYTTISTYYLSEENESELSADDFTVPAGETWYISEVYCGGAYHALIPDFMGVKIFADNSGQPGNQLYEQTNLLPLEGFPTSENAVSFMTILFPEPFVAQPGKYWISYYGIYEYELDADYSITLCTTTNGSPFHFFEYSSGYWESDDTYPSIYFRIQGAKTATQAVYNVYRDGEPIQTNSPELFFADVDFNPASPHKWSVRVACPAGDQSPPIYRERESCLGCNPITDFTAEWKMEEEECVSVELNWVKPVGEENVKYTIKRNNVVIAADISGTSYTDTGADPKIVNNYGITFMCDIVATNPVNATAPKCGVGINDVVKIDFSIRPNPATNSITVVSGEELNKIEIINFLGQTVISQINNDKLTTVDISNLSSGIYFVRAISANGANVKKFVKQ